MQRLLACVAVIVFAVPAVVVADEYQDSLRRVAYQTGPDARSAEHLYELFNELWPGGYELFPEYKDTLEAELKRYRDAEAEPRALLMVEMTVGSHYKMMSEPVTSIRHLYAALALERQVDDPELRAALNREIGLNYYLRRSRNSPPPDRSRQGSTTAYPSCFATSRSSPRSPKPFLPKIS